MTVLILAEHDGKHITKGTRVAVTAAAKLDSGDSHLLVCGESCGDIAAQAATISGIARVIHADGPALKDRLAENVASLIARLGKDGAYSHILAPASTFGKNVMPRAAALMDVQAVSDVTGIEAPDIFVRPVYAGNAFAKVKSSERVHVLTIRTTAFDAAEPDGGSAEIEAVDAPEDAGLSRLVGRELTRSERPELTAAEIVVSGGRALGSTENFALIEKLADRLGAAIGASRAAVDSGYVPNDYQVGQTGKVVAPNLYIAIGISGAIQHLAGMKDSKVIVAINKDADAPIFQIADYGLAADLFEAVPELIEKL